VDGPLTLVGWFILAGICLSPILVFWVATVISRSFLRRKVRQHLQRRVDRMGLTDSTSLRIDDTRHDVAGGSA
jgi:uncharacterized membrane protein YdjX (TVP38/TMEM64 family)